MDNTKSNEYYHNHIRINLEFIIGKMSGVSMESFSMNEVLQDSMMFRLIQISEDAAKLSDDYKGMYTQIPWGDIYGLRNRIVHDYGHIDFQIIYDTLTVDIPLLWHQLEI